MDILKKIMAYGSMAASLALLIVFILPTYRQGEASIAGQQAEDFSLQLDGKPAQDFAPQLAGKPAHLSDLQGKVVVLNFWATWCPPCVEETPALNRLQQQITSRGGVVLGVSVDEDGAAYEKFLKDQGVIFPTSRDATKKSAQDYGTVMYPETYIIDRHGKIARKVIGPQQWDSPDMLAYFDAVLGQN
jgi:cytochrome c biogenesis protein CcmG/thiol:disulfide interchange protein DsbE